MPSSEFVLPPPKQVAVDALLPDRKNPRLGISDAEEADERTLMELLWRDFAVDEVALSIAASGYFEHEALFAEQVDDQYIVIEGNRRLAAVKLLLDIDLRKAVGATDLPRISSAAKSKLQHLPVIVCKRSDLWQYLGFKHVNGPQVWQSYAKAQYVAWVHNEQGISLEDIARTIGDKHTTVRRLYRGLMALEQAEEAGVFSLEDRWKKHFSFSHLYTGLDYSNVQSFLDLDPRRSFKKNPVKRAKLEELGDICLWLFGQKSRDREPLVRTQNPDLRNLDAALANEEGVAALRQGLPLRVSLEISLGDERLFRENLVTAKQALQAARGKQVTGDRGETGSLGIAQEVLEIAEAIYDDMRDKRSRRKSQAERRDTRE